jgi:hypothetical protein
VPDALILGAFLNMGFSQEQKQESANCLPWLTALHAWLENKVQGFDLVFKETIWETS